MASAVARGVAWAVALCVGRGAGRGLGLVLAAAMGVAALASLAPGSPAIATCAGAGPNHAALVVEHGDGSVVTRCVAFDTPQITGLALLEASGVAWSGQTFGGFGVAACALDGEPAHYSVCPGKDFYWAFFVSRAGGAWQFATSGMSAISLSSGDAEGFRYVPASGNAATPPAPAGVCATSGSEATPTSPATSAATPAATARPAATAASRPTATRPPAGAASPAGSAAASATPSAASATPSGGAEPSASTAAVAGVAGATSSSSSSDAPAASGAAPAPAQGGGLDLGLLLAAMVGGALGGLALLRLIASRRGAP